MPGRLEGPRERKPAGAGMPQPVTANRAGREHGTRCLKAQVTMRDTPLSIGFGSDAPDFYPECVENAYLSS